MWLNFLFSTDSDVQIQSAKYKYEDLFMALFWGALCDLWAAFNQTKAVHL